MLIKKKTIRVQVLRLPSMSRLVNFTHSCRAKDRPMKIRTKFYTNFLQCTVPAALKCPTYIFLVSALFMHTCTYVLIVTSVVTIPYIIPMFVTVLHGHGFCTMSLALLFYVSSKTVSAANHTKESIH